MKMKEIKTAVFTLEEAFKMVEENILQALQDMLPHFLKGYGDANEFEKFFNLSNNFSEVSMYFEDFVCNNYLEDHPEIDCILIINPDNDETKVIVKNTVFPKNIVVPKKPFEAFYQQRVQSEQNETRFVVRVNSIAEGVISVPFEATDNEIGILAKLNFVKKNTPIKKIVIYRENKIVDILV